MRAGTFSLYIERSVVEPLNLILMRRGVEAVGAREQRRTRTGKGEINEIRYLRVLDLELELTAFVLAVLPYVPYVYIGAIGFTIKFIGAYRP